MIPTYTTSVGLPKIYLAFDWPIQMKIPRTTPADFQTRICPGKTVECVLLILRTRIQHLRH